MMTQEIHDRLVELGIVFDEDGLAIIDKDAIIPKLNPSDAIDMSVKEFLESIPPVAFQTPSIEHA